VGRSSASTLPRSISSLNSLAGRFAFFCDFWVGALVAALFVGGPFGAGVFVAGAFVAGGNAFVFALVLVRVFVFGPPVFASVAGAAGVFFSGGGAAGAAGSSETPNVIGPSVLIGPPSVRSAKWVGTGPSPSVALSSDDSRAASPWSSRGFERICSTSFRILRATAVSRSATS